jgi:hypothetical protein
MVSAPPKIVSSDFGQLVGIRHLIVGIDCAIAGAATTVDAATPTPAAFKNSRRFMSDLPKNVADYRPIEFFDPCEAMLTEVAVQIQSDRARPKSCATIWWPTKRAGSSSRPSAIQPERPS